MGKSISIEELDAADQKFRDYLADRRKEVTKAAAETRKKMDAAIEKFYKDGGWDDRKPVCSAEYIDVQNIQEWSLANVNKILTGIGGAIFGSQNPPPGLTLAPDVAAGLNPVVNAVGGLQMLALAKAFSAIQGILEAFTLHTSTKITMNHKIEVVTPGITTFIFIDSNSFQQKSFFNNSLITQYFFQIDVYSSNKQLGDYSRAEDLWLFEETKAAYRSQIRKVIKEISKVDDINKVEQLSKQNDALYANLQAIDKKINELGKAEAESHREIVQNTRLRLANAATAAKK